MLHTLLHFRKQISIIRYSTEIKFLVLAQHELTRVRLRASLQGTLSILTRLHKKILRGFNITFPVIKRKDTAMSRILTWPNRVTLLRIGLLFVLVFFIYDQGIWSRVFAALLTILVIVMDWLDGFLARKLAESTAIGSVLDVAGDRVVECVLWICLADLGLIGVWIPILVISRDIFTDSIRNYVMKYGYSGFGEKSMMRSRIGRFLTGAPIMRTSYAIAKAVTFAVLLLASGLEKISHHWPHISSQWGDIGLKIGSTVAIFTAVLCLVRGIPVIIEGTILIQQKEDASEPRRSAGH
jgi:CDP-diacylglycerol---glycerol-3-phosphate 3-phosphatidyltransferase